MEEERDKAESPRPAGDAEPAATTPLDPLAGLPEEAEIIEIVDDDERDIPTQVPRAPAPRRAEPTIPQGVPIEQAMEQIRNLRSQLDRKDKQIEQVMEAYRSKKTETEKQRERIAKSERRRFEQSKGDFIARFVEVLDNLDRAIDSIEDNFDADAVLQGIMLVRSRLVQLLKTEGLEKIFVRGQPFDPMHSEAAEMVEVDESQDGVVVKELQPGYMLKGSLLRAARVVVGQNGVPPRPPLPPQDASFPLAAPPQATPPAAAAPSETPAETDSTEDSASIWEADESGHDLEFSDDGLDFSGQ